MHQIIIDKIHIPYANQDRTLRIYLPPNYDDHQRFPVIYMHDAQNLYDIATSSYGAIWDVHTHLNQIYASTGQGFIVVGIDNYEGRTNRLDEYSPWVNTTIKNGLLESVTTDVGGLGDQYVRFIVTTLKPMIDQRFKTLTDKYNTAMIGSSMGGLISLYAGMAYPDIFGKIGAFSTAVWFAEEDLLNMIHETTFDPKTTWYLDIGTKESSNDSDPSFHQRYLQGTLKVHEALSSKLPESQLKLVVEEGAIHNERDWSRRYQPAIEFLFQH